MSTASNGLGHGARRYPDTLPDSPTLGLELPPVCVGIVDEDEVRNHYHSDDYNPETRDGDEPESNDKDGDADGDWFWQCHLCAHTNPLPPFYRDFASVPLSLSQPCGNIAVPPRKPSYSYSAVMREERSWEARMRGPEGREGLGEREGKSAYKQPTVARIASLRRGKRGASTSASCSSTKSAKLATATGMAGMAGVNYTNMSLNYAFSTADSSRSGPSTPIRYRGTGVRAWPGLGSAIAPKIAAGNVSADSSASISGGVTAPPMICRGSNLYVQTAAQTLASGTGAGTGTVAGTGSSARTSSKCPHRRCEGCYDLDASKRIVRFCGGSSVNSQLYAAWYASFGFVDGIETAVVDRGGLKVRQRESHRGADISELELEGENGHEVRGGEIQEADGRGEREQREDLRAAKGEYADLRLSVGVEYHGIMDTGEEKFMALGEEALISMLRNDPSNNSITQLPRDGPACSQALPSSQARYTIDESRILRVQTVDGRSDDGREEKAARASSGDGERVFGEARKDDENDGEDSESCGSQGWVEPITFVHRGSQEGGGCSESDGDDEGADGDDEREEEDVVCGGYGSRSFDKSGRII